MKHYKRRTEEWGIGRYEHEFLYMYRYPKTFNESRQNTSALQDGHHVRGRRRNLPTCWEDLRLSRCWGRSWKDYTKSRKQYGTGR